MIVALARIGIALALVGAGLYGGAVGFGRAGIWLDHPPPGAGRKTAELETAIRSATQASDPAIAALDALGERLHGVDPLSATPFELRLASALSERDADLAGRTAAEALRRDARNVPARLFLLDQALKAEDHGRSVSLLSELYTLWPSRQSDVLNALAAMATDPGSSKAVEEALNSRPRWGGQLAVKLAQSDVEPEFARRLYALYPDHLSGYLRHLVNTGRAGLAYLFWAGTLDNDELEALTVPVDEDFRGVDAAEPFNWGIDSRYAERQPQGGLYVVYFGREAPHIASQTISLTPGAYRIVTRTTGRWPDAGGTVEWAVRCLNGRQIAAIDVRLKDRGTFSVPMVDCPFQVLVLRGRPGEYPQTLRAEINSVSIEPLGDGADE